MFLTTKGIILRTVKYSESSLILDIYTEKKGRKSFIVSGIRSKSAKTRAGLLQVMGLVDFVSYDKDTSSLSRIKEINADYLYKRLPFEVNRSSLGMLIVEVCAKSIKESEANFELFSFLRNKLLELDEIEESKLSLFHIVFLLELCEYLGFAVRNNFSKNNCYFSLRDGCFANFDYGRLNSMDKRSSSAFYSILAKQEIEIVKELRIDVLEQLLVYYKYHVQNFGSIRSMTVLRSVFN